MNTKIWNTELLHDKGFKFEQLKNINKPKILETPRKEFWNDELKIIMNDKYNSKYGSKSYQQKQNLRPLINHALKTLEPLPKEESVYPEDYDECEVYKAFNEHQQSLPTSSIIKVHSVPTRINRKLVEAIVDSEAEYTLLSKRALDRINPKGVILITNPIPGFKLKLANAEMPIEKWINATIVIGKNGEFKKQHKIPIVSQE